MFPNFDNHIRYKLLAGLLLLAILFILIKLCKLCHYCCNYINQEEETQAENLELGLLN